MKQRIPHNQTLTLIACLLIASAVALGQASTAPAAPEAQPSPDQAPVAQQLQAKIPAEVEGLEPDEKLNEHIPLSLTFKDERGKTVTLDDYFKGDKPVILNLGYFRCPMLCGLILNGLTDAMKEIPWTPGQEFEVLTVSFDARETPTLANLKKQNYIKSFGRPSAAAGWHFLTGDEANIQALCDAVGYKFRWNAKRAEYAHPSVLIIMTPEGKISRYLYGVQFVPTTLRLSLVEASQGKIGTTKDRVLLYCFHYDADAGTYSLAAQRVMTVGGILTVFVLSLWLVPQWRRRGSSPAVRKDDDTSTA